LSVEGERWAGAGELRQHEDVRVYAEEQVVDFDLGEDARLEVSGSFPMAVK
jgi:hypothetical protein